MRTLLFVIIFVFTAFIAEAQKTIPEKEIKKLDGTVVSTQSLIDGEYPVVISFWATWCKPCLIEMDAISDVYNDWQDEINFKYIAISTDDARSSSRVKSLTAGKGWEFDFYLDDNQELKRALNINNIPYTIIIDKDGKIVYKHSGYNPGDEYELYEKVEELQSL